MSELLGYVAPNSSNSHAKVVADANAPELLALVGKMSYFDVLVEGTRYRAIGTIAGVMTQNNNFLPALASKGTDMSRVQKDVRETGFNVQSVFKETENGWVKYSGTLPTSPTSSSAVKEVTMEVVAEMMSNQIYPSIGCFLNTDIPLPIDTPDFGGNRGALHSAVIGKSGGGKTASYAFTIATFMRHEQHAIVVVDPQGQWSNENGFIFSPQRFARALGREVQVIRIAEDVRLPRDPELIARLIGQIKAWSRFRRMGNENQAIFSREVAERLVRFNEFDEEPRTLLGRAFSAIANSRSSLKRIYADEKIRTDFQEELKNLVGEEVVDKDGVPVVLSDEDIEDIETSWVSILKAFRPLLSLFSSQNLIGEQRSPLGGPNGVLQDIFKIRSSTTNPAPYVIIDMSPDVRLHAVSELDKSNNEAHMGLLLDKDSIKAIILQVVFEEIKKASEVAFSIGGGNLNTQIVFDEAWRYAPEGKAIPEVMELADMLEGFALDTRKFGIGWTYILQSPNDLKRGIWNQLTFIHSTYGLVGNDVKVLEDRYSDKSQTELYKSFISPASTGKYPLMIVGSISPLIFTNSPTFLDIFTSKEDFIKANKTWINALTTSRGLGIITAKAVDPALGSVIVKKPSAPVKTGTYKVGKNYDRVEPQYKADKNETPVSDKSVNDNETGLPQYKKPKENPTLPF